MEKRTLGRTGEKISAFGFGGIVVSGMPQDEANREVARAVEEEVNYFDVAPIYGNAQQILGPALKPYRNKVMLACKSNLRDAEGARKDLENSLKLLETDHFDVYQLHGIDKPEEIDQALAPGGALETILNAKQQGLIRFVGFSCHHQDAALKLMGAYDFDTVLFPFNWTYWLAKQAGVKVMEEATKRNMGIIAMKSMAHRDWLEGEERSYPKCWYKPIIDDDKLADLALRFTLSLPVSTALSPGDIRMFRLGMSIVAHLEKPSTISPEELEELTCLAAENSRFMW